MADLPKVPKVTSSEIAELMKEGEQLDIAELAKAKSEEMLGVLVTAANREGVVDEDGKLLEDLPSWAVATSAAKTVIEIAHGRTATQEVEKKDTGLTIVINQLFSSGTEEKVIEAIDLATDLADTIEIEGPDINMDELVDLTPILSKPSSE